jgi:hypothetical protein
MVSLDYRINAVAPTADGFMLLTDNGAVAMNRHGRTQWKRRFLTGRSRGSDCFLQRLGGGDYLAAWYFEGDDSGVDLARFGVDGTFKWSSSCPSCSEVRGFWFCNLGFHHDVRICVGGNRIVVNDTAGFRETLRLDNGQSLSRVDTQAVERWRAKLQFW